MIYLSNISVDVRAERNKRVHPFNLHLLRDYVLNISLNKDVSIIVGKNGSGKSTLLEAIASMCGYNCLGGGRNNILISTSETPKLAQYIKLSWTEKTTKGFFYRAETFFEFSKYIDDLGKSGREALSPYGNKSLLHQSHGESLISLFNYRFDSGLYILDEPETGLSPQSQLALLIIIKRLVKERRAQFIIATHSSIIITYPNADIFSTDDRLKNVKYHETDCYKITKDIVNNTKIYHDHLFDD